MTNSPSDNEKTDNMDILLKPFVLSCLEQINVVYVTHYNKKGMHRDVSINSLGKKLADLFMSDVKSINLNKLCDLACAVMHAQCQDQIVSPVEPFLRRTGVITDKLYEECARRAVNDFSSAEMTRLHENILAGKGYEKTTDNPERNRKAIENAMVEIKFKLTIQDKSQKSDQLEESLTALCPEMGRSVSLRK